MIENHTNAETTKQGFLLAPPSKPQNRKLPENYFRSYIDLLTDGYGGSKLVRNEPRTNGDIYFILRTSTTQVRSNRRNYSHRSVALYRTKKEGSTRRNIEYITCSFLELDVSSDSLEVSKYTLQSEGHFLTPHKLKGKTQLSIFMEGMLSVLTQERN